VRTPDPNLHPLSYIPLKPPAARPGWRIVTRAIHVALWALGLVVPITWAIVLIPATGAAGTGASGLGILSLVSAAVGAAVGYVSWRRHWLQWFAIIVGTIQFLACIAYAAAASRLTGWTGPFEIALAALGVAGASCLIVAGFVGLVLRPRAT
jgi:hypothetical protein